MSDTKNKCEGLKKSHVKSLVKTAKELGFKAYCMPCMRYGCAQPGLANFVVDWSTFSGGLPDKLANMQIMKKAMREARLNFFEVEE